MKRIFITIYVLLLVALVTIPFGVGPIIDEIFKQEWARAEKDLSKGTFSLIAERLINLDEDAQKKELEKLQLRFGYPLGLCRLTELQIDKKDEKDFLNGSIIKENGKNMLVQRMGNSQLALTMGGPFPGDELDIKVFMIFLGLFTLFLTLPAFAWTFFIYRDIKKIEKTTARFTSGDHGARAKVSMISSMTQIASAFNNMAEKSQKLIESQKELANSVSHEIRTPLARIKFSLAILLDSTEQEDINKQNNANEINKDVEEIESLVDAMLTYAKFEREPDSTSGLANNEMVSWLRTVAVAEQKFIPDKDIIFKTIPEIDKLITAFEPRYLGWAVRNLIQNASRHANTKVDITLEINQDTIAIHVDDDGPGVPIKAREQIFEPFFRLDESRNKKSGGHGFGLAIAKRITLWHKGSISAGESVSKGARFSIQLPISI